MEADEYFLGFARIALNSLHFDHRLGKARHRAESAKLTNQLFRVFTNSGCGNGSPEHAMRALISDATLHDALEDNGLTTLPLEAKGAAEDVPLLDLGRVNGLDGLHRKKAAQKFFKEPDQRWWLVRLYRRSK